MSGRDWNTILSASKTLPLRSRVIGSFIDVWEIIFRELIWNRKQGPSESCSTFAERCNEGHFAPWISILFLQSPFTEYSAKSISSNVHKWRWNLNFPYLSGFAFKSPTGDAANRIEDLRCIASLINYRKDNHSALSFAHYSVLHHLNFENIVHWFVL